MPKWSDYIRNLGTAGPATIEGIKALGFALTSEIPGLVAKYVRVDAAQTFTSGEQLQGRSNIGAGTIATQDADEVNITGGSIAGITDLAVADGGTGASSAPAARTNLGLGNVDNTSDADKPVSTATQTALDLKAPLASPALTGVPTAPTAAPGTDTTQVATTAFVAAASGAWERVGAPVLVTPGDAAVIFTDLGDFRFLRVRGFLRPTGDGAAIGVRTSTDNGANWDDGASDYGNQYSNIASAVYSASSAASSAFFLTSVENVGSASTEGIDFSVDVGQFNVPDRCYFRSDAVLFNAGGNINQSKNSGRRLDAVARNAIQIFANTTTLAHGFVVLEGIRG